MGVCWNYKNSKQSWELGDIGGQEEKWSLYSVATLNWEGLNGLFYFIEI